MTVVQRAAIAYLAALLLLCQLLEELALHDVVEGFGLGPGTSDCTIIKGTVKLFFRIFFTTDIKTRTYLRHVFGFLNSSPKSLEIRKIGHRRSTKKGYPFTEWGTRFSKLGTLFTEWGTRFPERAKFF